MDDVLEGGMCVVIEHVVVCGSRRDVVRYLHKSLTR